MTERDEPRDEVLSFLQGHAAANERAGDPIEVDEATNRVISRRLAPRSRFMHAPGAVAHEARRRPAMAAAVMATLLIGGVAGFAAGRGSAPGSASARGAARDSTTPTTVIEQSGGGGRGAPGPYFGLDGSATMTRLFLRATADGIEVRAYLQEWPAAMPEFNEYCGADSWCPPPQCNPTSNLLAEVSTKEAVGQGFAPAYGLETPAASRGPVQIGQLEGAPASVYMVQTTADVTNVRANWPDGFVDEMAPVDGWAVVGHSGTAPPTIVAVGRDGTTTQLTSINGQAIPAACEPPPPAPPTLPPPGAEQPDDVAAASDAVRAAYVAVYTYSTSPEDKAAHTEDAQNLRPIQDEVNQRYESIASTVVVEVGEMVFLSKTEAALLFTLTHDSGSLGTRVGYAKLIDGVWKVARVTSCEMLALGGGECPPPATK